MTVVPLTNAGIVRQALVEARKNKFLYQLARDLEAAHENETKTAVPSCHGRFSR